MTGPIMFQLIPFKDCLRLHLQLIINKINLIIAINILYFGEKRFCVELMAEISPKFKAH